MAGKVSLSVFLLFLVSFVAASPAATLSEDPTSRLSTVPHDEAMQAAVEAAPLELVVVNHEGWRETIPSFARLKLYELTGRQSIYGQLPEYTILSIIYENEKWRDAKIFPLEHPALQEMLGVQGKWVSSRDVVESKNLHDLVKQVENVKPLRAELLRVEKVLSAVTQAKKLGPEPSVFAMYRHEGIDAEEVRSAYNDGEQYEVLFDRRNEIRAQLEEQKPLLKAGEKLLDRVFLLADLPSQFLVVPDSEAVELQWVRPVSAGAGKPIMQAGRDFDMSLAEAFALHRPVEIAPATKAFLDIVQRSRYYPTETFRRAQNTYIEYNPWKISSFIYLFSAGIFGLYFFFQRRSIYWTAFGVMAGGLVIHTCAVGIRAYLTGHVPVSNMYESITFSSWAVMAIAIGFEAWSRKGLVGVGAAGLGFLYITAASLMPLHETRIHPLRAVLNSYWLNIHVTMMLISYAAFALSAFFAGLFLLKKAFRRDTLIGSNSMMTLPQTEEFAYRLVQFGWPLLTFGIALGAVWADTAWGRFWGWDPKETWAFITWVGYTVYLHMRMVMGWRGTWSAAACLGGFVLVLITWLGVSYLPMFAGGLHSYASPNSF